MADRYGVDLATVFEHSATQLQSTSDRAEGSLQALEGGAVGSALVDRPKPELKRNILRLSAADFAGPYRGNVGGESFAGADRLFGRYRRLRGF